MDAGIGDAPAPFERVDPEPRGVERGQEEERQHCADERAPIRTIAIGPQKLVSVSGRKASTAQAPSGRRGEPA